MLIVSTIIWATMGYNSLKNRNDSTSYTTINNSFSQHLLYTLAIVCNQRNEAVIKNSKHLSCFNMFVVWIYFQDQGISVPIATRPVLAVWCLTSVILICYYSTGIISFLTVPKLRPVVNSIEELSSSSVLQVAAIKSSIFETIFLVFKIL